MRVHVAMILLSDNASDNHDIHKTLIIADKFIWLQSFGSALLWFCNMIMWLNFFIVGSTSTLEGPD